MLCVAVSAAPVTHSSATRSYHRLVPDLATDAPLPPDPAAPRPAAPQVRLGRTHRNGIAPSLYALVDRAVQRDPLAAAQVRGRVVLRFREDYVPTRITFGKRMIRVEDGDLRQPDLAITGRLPDIVLITTARLRMGLPDPTDGRGRAALARIATGRLRISGDTGLARAFMELMRIDAERDRSHPPPEPADERAAGEPGWIELLV